MTKFEIEQKAIGTWKIFSIFGKCQEDGSKNHYYGDNPTGILMYQPEGYMTLQLVTNPRQPFESEDWEKGTDAEIRCAFLSYQAYYGKYYYDEEVGAMIHEIHGSLFPNWHLRKSKEVRFAKFEQVGEDEFLHITTPSVEIEGKNYIFYACWKRVKEKAS